MTANSANTGNTDYEALTSGRYLFLVDGYITTLSTSGYNSANSIGLGSNDYVVFGGSSSFEGNMEFASMNGSNINANNISCANIVTSNLTVLSNTMILGGNSLSVNGYSWLPNGLKMNWGVVVVNSTSGNATYVNSFSNNTLMVSVTPISNVLVGDNTCFVESSNSTVAVIRSATTNTTSNVYFYAIGY